MIEEAHGPEDQYFVRPTMPEAHRLPEPTDEEVRELLRQGLTEVDRSAWEVHVRAHTRHARQPIRTGR